MNSKDLIISKLKKIGFKSDEEYELGIQLFIFCASITVVYAHFEFFIDCLSLEKSSIISLAPLKTNQSPLSKRKSFSLDMLESSTLVSEIARKHALDLRKRSKITMQHVGEVSSQLAHRISLTSQDYERLCSVFCNHPLEFIFQPQLFSKLLINSKDTTISCDDLILFLVELVSYYDCYFDLLSYSDSNDDIITVPEFYNYIDHQVQCFQSQFTIQKDFVVQYIAFVCNCFKVTLQIKTQFISIYELLVCPILREFLLFTKQPYECYNSTIYIPYNASIPQSKHVTAFQESSRQKEHLLENSLFNINLFKNLCIFFKSFDKNNDTLISIHDMLIFGDYNLNYNYIKHYLSLYNQAIDHITQNMFFELLFIYHHLNIPNCITILFNLIRAPGLKYFDRFHYKLFITPLLNKFTEYNCVYDETILINKNILRGSPKE
ncbi:hypothetical protein WA158_007674 [Blastocystis sp. Blastoise]